MSTYYKTFTFPAGTSTDDVSARVHAWVTSRDTQTTILATDTLKLRDGRVSVTIKIDC